MSEEGMCLKRGCVLGGKRGCVRGGKRDVSGEGTGGDLMFEKIDKGWCGGMLINSGGSHIVNI